MHARRLAASVAVVGFVGCATSSSPPAGFADDGGAPADGGNVDSPHNLFDAQGDTSADGGCATATYEGKAAPAAMLFVLDASGTMADNNKYASAQQAIVTAMDQDAFDTMSLGLLLYPQVAKVAALCPALGGLAVNCAVSGLPQVALAPAGLDKSNAGTGVRSQIYNTLATSTPTAGPGNGNPAYDALQNAIASLKAYNLTGKRLLFFITDGGPSCTSQDMPQRPYYPDAYGCTDWENPGNIMALLKAAHDDPTSPINSLIVGVKGSDNTSPTTDPPYRMRRALSAYALAGSPETVPAGCDGAYSQSGGDPASACHFDLTTNPSFTQALTDGIGLIRNKLIGCVFDLPKPDGGTTDPNKVNVDYSVGGGAPTGLKKRSNPGDTCATDGCWDYGADGRVNLIGKACDDVKASPSAKVDIVVGCQTIIK